MTQRTFDKVMLEKYGSYENLYSGIHHYETNEIKNSLGLTVLKSGIEIQPTWKTNGNFVEIINSKIDKIYTGTKIYRNEAFEGETTIEVFRDISNSEIEVYKNKIKLSDEEFIKNSASIILLEPCKGGEFIEIISLLSTKTVTVEMINGIPGLRPGSIISIDNVAENEFNGKEIIVKEIITQGASNIKEFTFELPELPNQKSLILSNPRREEVLFLPSNNDYIFIIADEDQDEFIDINYEVGSIEIYKNNILLEETEFIANDGKRIILSKPCLGGEIIKIVSSQQLIKGNSYYYEYWDSGLGYSVLVPSSSFVNPITNYEYEIKIEEEKRNIYVLKPRYLNVIFDDMEDLMLYKKGSTQYVSETLKRGDNIRLYD
jgi:hypothetical protein